LQTDFNDTITPYIKDYVGVDQSPGPWLAGWQFAPAIPNTFLINLNRFASGNFAMLSESILNGRGAITLPWAIDPNGDLRADNEYGFVNQMLTASQGASYGLGEPLSCMYYPIFDTFSPRKPKVVATLEGMVYWRSYFERVLPEKVRGMVVVVKNNYNMSFTYAMNGEEAVFLGNSDVHSTAYDHMMIKADYASFQDLNIKSQTVREYRGVDVEDSITRYWIEVYPSDEMQAIYLTKRPLYYMLAMVFFFTLTVSFTAA